MYYGQFTRCREKHREPSTVWNWQFVTMASSTGDLSKLIENKLKRSRAGSIKLAKNLLTTLTVEYFLDTDIELWILESLSSSFKGIIGFLRNFFSRGFISLSLSCVLTLLWCKSWWCITWSVTSRGGNKRRRGRRESGACRRFEHLCQKTRNKHCRWL